MFNSRHCGTVVEVMVRVVHSIGNPQPGNPVFRSRKKKTIGLRENEEKASSDYCAELSGSTRSHKPVD